MTERILVLIPEFHDIDEEVKLCLQKMSINMELISNKTFRFDDYYTSGSFKFIRRLYFKLSFTREKFLKRELDKIGNDFF